jgi:hypothetical protein
LALEALNTVVRTILDEGMQVVVGHATVVALKIGQANPRVLTHFLCPRRPLRSAYGRMSALERNLCNCTPL